jgi:hypothetical protein
MINDDKKDYAQICIGTTLLLHRPKAIQRPCDINKEWLIKISCEIDACVKLKENSAPMIKKAISGGP